MSSDEENISGKALSRGGVKKYNEQQTRSFYAKLQDSKDEPLNDNKGEESIAESKDIEAEINGSDLHKSLFEELSTNVPNTVKPDTIGDYLYGCAYSQDEAPRNCTPSCLKGFHPPGHLPCDKPVYERNIYGLKKLNDTNGSEAYIYVTGSKDIPLNKSERITLQDHGVKNVIVYDREDKSIRYRKVGHVTIPTKDTESISFTEQEVDTGAFDGKYIMGIFAVIIIIIILFLLLWVWSRNAGCRGGDCDNLSVGVVEEAVILDSTGWSSASPPRWG